MFKPHDKVLKLEAISIIYKQYSFITIVNNATKISERFYNHHLIINIPKVINVKEDSKTFVVGIKFQSIKDKTIKIHKYKKKLVELNT